MWFSVAGSCTDRSYSFGSDDGQTNGIALFPPPTHCTSLIRAGRMASSWVVLCSADYLRAELGKSWPLFGIHRYGGGDVFRISSFMKCTFINTSPSRLNDTGPPPFGQQSQYMTGNGPKPDLQERTGRQNRKLVFFSRSTQLNCLNRKLYYRTEVSNDFW